MKLRLTALSRDEIERIRESGQLTQEQSRLLSLLASDKLTDEGAMRKLSMSSTEFYRVKKELKLKILRVLLANALYI
jgi:hypothetical protein